MNEPIATITKKDLLRMLRSVSDDTPIYITLFGRQLKKAVQHAIPYTPPHPVTVEENIENSDVLYELGIGCFIDANSATADAVVDEDGAVRLEATVQ